MNQVNEQELQDNMKLQQQFNNIESMVRQHLDKNAVARLGNIKAANKEKSMQLTLFLAKIIQENQVNMITDEQLKQVLMQLEPEKKEIKIRRM